MTDSTSSTPKPAAKKDGAVETTGRVVGVDEAQEAGYIGQRATKHPDSAYSLETGPDAPTGDRGPE